MTDTIQQLDELERRIHTAIDSLFESFRKSHAQQSLNEGNIKNIDEYPLCDNLQAFSEIINLSSRDNLFSFNKSNATIDVIILVIEAG